MKNITNLCIELQEGKISKKDFLREARMTFPNYITNVNTFKDTIKILKSRNLISEGCNCESQLNELAPRDEENDDPIDFDTDNIKMPKRSLRIDRDTVEPASPSEEDLEVLRNLDIYGSENNMFEDEYEWEDLDEDHIPGDEDEEIVDDYIWKIDKDDYDIENDYDADLELIDFDNDLLHEAKEPKFKPIGSKYDGSDSKYNGIEGGDEVDPLEQQIGMRYERSIDPTGTTEKWLKKVNSNLSKQPRYYTQLSMAGWDAKKITPEVKKRTDLPVEMDKKMSNTIDKLNKMESPKGIEKDKASANKAKKETVTAVKGVEELNFIAKKAAGIKQRFEPTSSTMKVVREGFKNNNKLNETVSFNEIKDLLTKISQENNLFIYSKETDLDGLRNAIKINKSIPKSGIIAVDSLTDTNYVFVVSKDKTLNDKVNQSINQSEEFESYSTRTDDLDNGIVLSLLTVSKKQQISETIDQMLTKERLKDLTHKAVRAKGIKGVMDMTGGKMKKVKAINELGINDPVALYNKRKAEAEQGINELEVQKPIQTINHSYEDEDGGFNSIIYGVISSDIFYGKIVTYELAYKMYQNYIDEQDAPPYSISLNDFKNEAKNGAKNGKIIRYWDGDMEAYVVFFLNGFKFFDSENSDDPKRDAFNLKNKINLKNKKSINELEVDNTGILSKVQSFIDSKFPDIKNEIRLTESKMKVYLKYDYWDELPSNVLNELETKFNVRKDATDEGEDGVKTFYVLSPKITSEMMQEIKRRIKKLFKK